MREHLCFIAFCEQTSYRYFGKKKISLFEGNTCSALKCSVLVWLGHIALMKPSTDELWEHRSLSYSCNEVAGVNESHTGTEREEDE